MKTRGMKAECFRVYGMPDKVKRHVRKKIIERCADSEFLVFFNAKFDLAWLRHFGIELMNGRVWDTQLWEFHESHQRWRYPDLATTCIKHGVQAKKDIVAENYWSKGLDTLDVPKRVLRTYGNGDVESTEAVFLSQYNKSVLRSWHKLFRVQCADLLVLHEMEYTGLAYDEEESLRRAEQTREDSARIQSELHAVRNEGFSWDFNSPDHTSVYLYGGTIVDEQRVCVGTYKTGAKMGQPRYKIVRYEHKFDPLIDPKKFKVKEAKKAGFYLCSEPILKGLKVGKRKGEILEKLLKYRELEKLAGTYYEGLPKLRETMGWKYGELHGQFNQVVVVTGRLSCASPNQQNFTSEIYQLFRTRFK